MEEVIDTTVKEIREPEFMTRMRDEYAELDGRINLLGATLQSDVINDMTYKSVELMKAQAKAMIMYRDVLYARMKLMGMAGVTVKDTENEG